MDFRHVYLLAAEAKHIKKHDQITRVGRRTLKNQQQQQPQK